jgi:hypothetical protein
MLVKEFCEMVEASLVLPDLPDYVRPEDILERRTAAHIVHNILKNVLNEPDEPDITSVFELKDIYECKVCFPHIAQVYVKGIMPVSGNAFGVRNPVDKEEAKEIVSRIFDNTLRNRPEAVTFQSAVSVLTEDGLEKLIKEYSPLILDIDTIDAAETGESKLKDFIITKKEFDTNTKITKIPMTQIIRNPYCIRSYIESIARFDTNDLAYPVVILSRSTECAQTTGECLVQAGYRNVWMVYFDPVFMQKIWGKRVNESKPE